MSVPEPFGVAGWLLLHFALALAATWFARGYALRRDLLDHPGERRSHRVATPRGGGVSIVLAMLLALLLLAAAEPAFRAAAAVIAGGLLLVAGVGWVDDHRPLSPWFRLAVHALAAGLLAAALLLSGAGATAASVAFCLALVLVNVWNFMDGIDGLAASQAAIAAAGYAWIAGSGPAAGLALALAAACLGFLPFNFPRARIFLGDVGSGALGYGLAAIAAWLLREGAMPQWPVLVLPLTAFLIDASLTLIRRMVRGDRWWTPHVEHAYQRWAFHRRSHRPVTLWYGLWSVLATVMLVALWSAPAAVIMAAVVMWCLAGGLAWMRLQRDAGRALT